MTRTANKGVPLNKVILATVLVLNLLFLAYWIVLALYSRPHYDDLHFLWKMREMTIFEYVKEMYLTRSGRFVAYAINGIMASVTNVVGFHQLWAIFYYALGIVICIIAINGIDLPISKTARFAGVCLFYNLYVLTNIDFPVFYWLCAMTYYLCFPIACLTFVYLNKSSLNWKEWIVLIVSAVFLGGGNEAFTPVFLIVMFICGLYWWYSQKWDIRKTWKLPQVQRIVWVSLLILFVLIIVVVAPGNYVRMNGDSQFSHPDSLVGWGRATIEAMVMFSYFMAFYIPYLLVLFLLAFCVGSRLSVRLARKKIVYIICIISGFFVYLMASCIPNVFLFGGFGVQRTYTHVVCALLLTVCSIGLVSGIGKSDSWAKWGSFIGAISLIVIMFLNLYNDTPTARHYAQAVDERVEQLNMLQAKGQIESVKVSALPVPYTEDSKHFLLKSVGIDSPKSVLYYISDTDVEPNEYEFHMKKLLGLDFDFTLDALGEE